MGVVGVVALSTGAAYFNHWLNTPRLDSGGRIAQVSKSKKPRFVVGAFQASKTRCEVLPTG
jgi:hypothetical protein